tara:strand:- start:756 stop:1736 length:981 start_codon:yes stop_codon:yes gene_type:complete
MIISGKNIDIYSLKNILTINMSCSIEEYSYNPYIVNLPSTSNQDRGNVWPIVNNHNNGLLIVIADGHGNNGHVFSEYIIDYFEKLINSNIVNWFDDDLTNVLNNIFKNMEIELNNKFDHLDGGSTLSICVLRKNRDIWIANVGDSDIQIINPKSKLMSKLTESHDPLNIQEASRILKSFPETVFEYDRIVKSEPIIPIYKNKDNTIELNELPTLNVYYKNRNNDFATYIYEKEEKKIALTRSIGDFYHKRTSGLSSKPYICSYEYLKENEFLICATDGFWDCWTRSEIIDYIANKNLSNFEEEHFNKSIKYFGKNRDDSYMVLLKN